MFPLEFLHNQCERTAKMEISVLQDQLTAWAETCLRINRLNTLVQHEIDSGDLERAKVLSMRARTRAWNLFNELITNGGKKPSDYTEPDSSPLKS
jgi:hypothetical protein